MSESSQPRHDLGAPGSHYQPALGVVLVLVVLFVLATFLMLRSSSPSTSSFTATSIPSTTVKSPKTTTTLASKSRVRVQVANGTKTTGLANSYTQQLITSGWDALAAVNGPQVAATVIYYNPGFKWAALEISHEIHTSAQSVQPVNGTVAVGVAGASNDDVVIVLGPDVAIIQG